ncbi:hypothetical protein ACLBKU_05245 [Erythrobacter sp. NE805]|uniref:hypothetical protein n=1 Tax=Erythrobacter sp. NE805 TaxID=3389875 RepID=UPI00396B1923
MILATLLSPLFAMQAAGESAVAIKNDNPETWSVEYPRLIQPMVADYRRCLVVTDRRISGRADLEQQHAADITRCAARKAKAIAESNEILAGAKTTLTPAQVDTLFDNIGKIHVARGRDLDQQFITRVSGAQAASESYDATRPKGLVLELRDASVVKARTDAAAAAAGAATAAAKKDKDGK